MSEKTDQPESIKAKFSQYGLVSLVCMFGLVGGLLVFRHGNAHALRTLTQFTSPKHQTDRCDLQAAITAQERMRQHFIKKGGLSSDQTEVMALFTGLTKDQAQGLATKHLYSMDFGCGTPRAGVQEAVVGLMILSLVSGVGITVIAVRLYNKR